MDSPSFFNSILIWPIVNLLVAIYQGLVALHIPYALGFAIIALTIVIRLLLYPFTSAQLRASHKMQKLTPHLKALKSKHKDDAKMLQAETMKLYKEHGVNPLAGCLPLLIQLPLLWALYNVLQQVVSNHGGNFIKSINKVLYFKELHLQAPLTPDFFGLPLGKSPSELLGTVGVLILLVPLGTALFQFLQSKMMMPEQPKTDKPAVQGEKKDFQEDFAQAFQAQSMYIFPLMIGFFAFQFQFGLSLYWNTFTIFGMIQQYQIQGLGSLTPWMKKISRKKE